MTAPNYYFVFDVESIGLHGEGYAVGYVVVDPSGIEMESGRFACPPSDAMGDDSDREWVEKNIPRIPANCCDTNLVRVKFWEQWMKWKAKGAVLVSDCGWPVEARFLAACVDWDTASRKWEGPYPLHDLASVMLANGIDPMGNFDRLEDELPKHDPLCDARQSARLFVSLVGRAAGAGVGLEPSAAEEKYNVRMSDGL